MLEDQNRDGIDSNATRTSVLFMSLDFYVRMLACGQVWASTDSQPVLEQSMQSLTLNRPCEPPARKAHVAPAHTDPQTPSPRRMFIKWKQLRDRNSPVNHHPPRRRGHNLPCVVRIGLVLLRTAHCLLRSQYPIKMSTTETPDTAEPTPRCTRCGASSAQLTGHTTRNDNPKGNASRPYLKCSACDRFITYVDGRG